MTDVIVVIGAGQIGQAIARRVGIGKHVLLADMRQENAAAAAEVLSNAGFEVSVATVDVSSREAVGALVGNAAALGDVTGLIQAAGVSPSQASPATILKVDLYGTALVLETFGNVIARGGAGVVIASQSGHRLPPQMELGLLWIIAGLTTLKVDLSVAEAGFTGAIDAGVLYQQHAKPAGIDLNVIRESDDGYYDYVWLKKPWTCGYWNGRPTCDWLFTTIYAKGAAWNESHYADPRFNELLVAARAEVDDKKRAAMYAEMQQLLHDTGGTIVLVFNNYVEGRSVKLAHGPIAPNFEADGLKIAERWWFA